MNAQKFKEDFEYYKTNLSKKLDKQTVGIMLHAYCMGYCGMAGHVLEEFDMTIGIDPVLDKISELNPFITKAFNTEPPKYELPKVSDRDVILKANEITKGLYNTPNASCHGNMEVYIQSELFKWLNEQ